MIRLARSIPLLALVGCAGSVFVEDLDPFGGAASAIWLHDDDSHLLMLSNVGGLCAKWQNYLEVVEDAWDDVADLDVSDDDYCQEAREPMFAYARAGDALYHEGAHYLTLQVRDDDGTEPSEDTYEVGGDKKALGGSVTYFGESAYSAILSDWDVKDDFEGNCGLSLRDFESESDTWSLDEGELEITRVADERGVSGRLEGELVDRDGDDEGEIAARFSASYCEIDG